MIHYSRGSELRFTLVTHFNYFKENFVDYKSLFAQHNWQWSQQYVKIYCYSAMFYLPYLELHLNSMPKYQIMLLDRWVLIRQYWIFDKFYEQCS